MPIMPMHCADTAENEPNFARNLARRHADTRTREARVILGDLKDWNWVDSATRAVRKLSISKFSSMFIMIGRRRL